MTTATEPETDVQWFDFCDREATRYAINAPRVANGWKIATDCRVAICQPTDEPNTPPSEKRWPNVMELLSPIVKGIGDVIPWPVVAPCECVEYPTGDDKATCPTCNGSRKVECSACDGEGEEECDMGHMHECRDCNGHGQYDCDDCDNGKVSRDSLAKLKCQCAVMVGGRAIAGPMFNKIATLPGVSYFVPERIEDQVWFRFDGGGFGIVMAVHPAPETKWRK